ncbi:XRE family transcriptional regulator [Clostridium sp. KNHs216]|uniref:XRE family transcriptional regulator n=1 Tax=Clostridium sp. KNHs216 TaxID=1550235 RepID=UPI00114F3599|nr:XRE family transcriptional regulator [Clostridium sp. KNHs216]TQI68968.1 hypothetical protein LY85_3716 [Clostridium sp. KNHs216]
MLKRALTPFGMEVKTKLLSIGQTQEWLIAQAKECTGMYVDSSNLYKLMTGQLHSKRLENAVRDVLKISEKGSEQ